MTAALASIADKERRLDVALRRIDKCHGPGKWGAMDYARAIVRRDHPRTAENAGATVPDVSQDAPGQGAA